MLAHQVSGLGLYLNVQKVILLCTCMRLQCAPLLVEKADVVLDMVVVNPLEPLYEVQDRGNQ